MFEFVLNGWRSRNITTKFVLGFGLLLMIGVLELIVTRDALQSIGDTERAIRTSMEAQRLSLEMSRNWQEALNLQSDFFLQYSKIGYDSAYRQYAIPAGSKFAEIIQDGATLRRLTLSPQASENIRGENEALQQYLGQMGNYVTQLEKAVQTTSEIEQTQVRLSHLADNLYMEIINSGQSSQGLSIYYEMRLLENEFLDSANSNSASLIFSSSDRLRQFITESDMDAYHKQTSLAILDEYDDIVAVVLQTSTQLQEKLSSLDEMAKSIEPNHVRFTLMAQTEVGSARNQIQVTRHDATIKLILTNISGLILVGIIIFVLNRSIIQNILKLTDAARELQKGNLNQHVHVNSNDEIGRLAFTFNSMSDEIRQMVGRLELIHQASLEMARHFEVKSIADTALDTAMQVSTAESGFIALGAGQDISVVQVAGPRPGVTVGDKLLEMDTLNVDNPQEMGFVSTSPQEDIVIPLVSREKWVGAIRLKSGETGHFQQNSLRFLKLLALRTAVAIDNAQMYREVQNLSVIDPLTEVYNRRGFFELCEREVARIAREKRAFSALFIDIDSFKMFNDHYGYDVGDLVLSSTAKYIKQNVRSIDVVGRYGGEEFVVLLPGLNLEKTIEVAERLRSGIANQFVQTQKGKLLVTVSIGAASLVFTDDSPELVLGKKGLLVNRLIDTASEMLREAKTKGKNRVVFSDHAMVY